MDKCLESGPWWYTYFMNNILRTQLAAFATVALLAAPLTASADTISDLQTQIQSLMAQLKSLQEQLHKELASSTRAGGMMGSTTIPRWGEKKDDVLGSNAIPGIIRRPCIAPLRALSQGMSGDDVRELQQQLVDDGDLDDSSATGFFGPRTVAAVHKLQARLGIASTTGSVGPLTRELLRKRCAEAKNHMQNQEVDHIVDRPRAHDMIMNQLSSTTMPMQPNMIGNFERQRPAEANAIRGTITSVDSNSIVVSNEDTSKTLSITDATVVRIYDTESGTMKNGTVANLAIGDQVMVHGMKTADGSAVAILIQKGLPAMGLHMMMRDEASTTVPMRPKNEVLKMLPGFVRGGDNVDH